MMSSPVEEQRRFFASGGTRSFAFRDRMLKRLAEAICDRQEDILAALTADLGKSKVQGYATEVGLCRAEITYVRRHLLKWMKPRRVPGPKLFPLSRCRVVPEPLGVCLVISPWNYPFALAILPLVACIAAGNCAVVKPSEVAANTERILSQMISECFDETFVSVVCGGPDASEALLRAGWDHIFYTGSERIARIVMTVAAQRITPVTLELGGKSPCIVAADCDIDRTAKRITWGKFLNAGQTCVAPDYLLVQKGVKDELIARIGACVLKFYGADPQQSQDYGRIINERHFDRLNDLMKEGRVILGGKVDRQRLYISPTLIGDVPEDGRIMEEEIFGPLLPVLEFADVSEALTLINRKPKPLALYVFSRSRDLQNRIISETSSGGVCVNDTVIHLTAPALPFGGVGKSGFGRYHGKAGFDALSNHKSVLRQTLLFDIPGRFPPTSEKDLRILRRMLR
ncbi:MAG: aldehyde dehydrogenase [Phycisphaerae bacterium]|nr:aldehyde dehydrogenase [Phycisphaerae bacterium]